MKKLEIELSVYGNALVVRVLCMDENLRRKGELVMDIISSMISKKVPALSTEKLFIDSIGESYDSVIIYNQYETEDEALVAGEMFLKVIDEINRDTREI